MSKTLCYSVKLAALHSISEKAYKAISFDGSEDILPKSQVFGHDYERTKTEAVWIASWILKNKKIQYSTKKQAWFDNNTRKQLPTYEKIKHKPKKVEVTETKPEKTLVR